MVRMSGRKYAQRLRANKRVFRRRVLAGMRRGLGITTRTPLVHKFKEWVQLPDLTASAGSLGNGILSPAINLLNNWPSYGALFDLYKVVGIKFKFLPQWNQAFAGNGLAPGGTGNASLPMMYLEVNHDPWAPAPVSVADILNTDNLRTYRLEKPFSVYVKAPVPKITWVDASGVEGEQALIMNNNARSRQWLTTGGGSAKVDQSGSPHYGIRYTIDNQYNTALNCQFKVFACFYFIMKEQD